MKCRKYDLFKIDEYGLYFNSLNKIIIDVLNSRELTFPQFSDLIFKAYKRNHPAVSLSNIISHRNRIIGTIFGHQSLSTKRFEYVMEQVLNESIDDPEIKQLILIGNGDDLRGQRFGRLVVKECLKKMSYYKLYWSCLCDCGNKAIVQSGSLKYDHTISCGCYHTECVTTHGMYHTKIYQSWRSMISRCYNTNSTGYSNYGGRGIIVCERWKESFENFHIDMGDRPKGMTLDRKDNDGNYELGNCRWATWETQASNKRNTLKFDDGTTVSELARNYELNYDSIKQAYYTGYSKADIISKYTKSCRR